MMYSNVEVVFKFWFLHAVELHNTTNKIITTDCYSNCYNLWLCVHHSNFQKVIISFNVIKQQIINDVQEF